MLSRWTDFFESDGEKKWRNRDNEFVSPVLSHAKLIEKWDIDYIYIDSAAQQTRFDFAQNYDISTINAKKSVLDGIGHVSAIIDNDKLYVDQECKQSQACLDAYQWDPNPNLIKEKPKHNMASHMADGMRYALYSFQTAQVSF